MSRPLFKNFGDAAEVATSVGKALRESFEKGNPGQDGSYVTAALLAGTEQSLEHTLGRVPSGWLVIDKDAASDVYRSGELSSTFIPLTASADVNVVVWVF